MTEREQSLSDQAAEARVSGDFAGAGRLYERAVAAAETLQERLHLMMRRAYCYSAVERHEQAVEIADSVAAQARAEDDCAAELADALSLIVDHHMFNNRVAEATQLLAEATYQLQRIPNEPPFFQVVHNMAVTYQRCNFPYQALELFDRSLRLATNEIDRTFTYASMTGCYHLAMLMARNPAERDDHIRNGIYSATATLDPEASHEILSEVIALAHRSVLLCHTGQYEAALADAVKARGLAVTHSLREEQVVAMVGEALARWHLDHDMAIVELVDQAGDLAREFGVETFLRSVYPITVEALWGAGRFEDAKAVMQLRLDGSERDLARERSARWEHVQLGVSHKETEAISESDPLTGLPNRRYLGHWLPEALEGHGPVCVGVLDLDGFKQINDNHSYAHGDRVLQELAGILRRTCRRGDSAVRLGGDEFVLVLRETSPGDARMVFERIRGLIANRAWEGLPRTVELTASIGAAVGSGADDAPRVLAAASEAVQIAKRSGRDRIVFR